MKQIIKEYSVTESTKVFDQLNTFFYLCGLKDFWVSELKLPKSFVKVYDKVLLASHPIMLLVMLSLCLTFYTQEDLTQRHRTDLITYTFTAPVKLVLFYSLTYYKETVRDIWYHLIIVLKEMHNDKEIQKQMIRKIKMFFGVFLSVVYGVMIERAFTSLLRTILYGDVFNPFAVCWPDKAVNTPIALAMRLLNYVMMWYYTCRLNCVNTMIFLLVLVPSYQFKDLQCYFYKLNDIFEDDSLSQEEKQEKYERAFKKGINIHVLSLWCVRQCQQVCRMAFNIMLLFILCSMVVVLPGLIITEGLSRKLTYVPLLLGFLTLLAMLMWNSGNITYEALLVPDAMYASGWQNCRGSSSVRVRKLVFLSMIIAQQPLVLKAFGIVEMSYENFVSIVKTSYSAFSVLYNI